VKKKIWAILLLLGLTIAPTQKSHAIVWIIVKAAIKKAILAADLAIQRQQNKVIWLQNAQKTLENAMSKLKLEEISDWSERQRSLYQNYFQELSKVKTIISLYKGVKSVSQQQLALVQEYNRAWGLIQKDKNFTPAEISYMGTVYQGILAETVRSIDQLSLVVNAFTTSMTDARRLEIIKAAAEQTTQNYSDLKRFNNENFMLSLSRSKTQRDVDQVKQLYGIQ
jgi:hypothetical protein